MPRTVRVKAAPLADPALAGKARVVKEGTTQRYITEGDPVEVHLTPYYARKLLSGELVEVQAGGLADVETSAGEDDR